MTCHHLEPVQHFSGLALAPGSVLLGYEGIQGSLVSEFSIPECLHASLAGEIDHVGQPHLAH
jgi:hypothetical protein